MKTTIRTTASLLSAIAALAVTADAAAQDRTQRTGPLSDGVLTRAEVLDQARTRFEATDANGDGYVSIAEAEAALDQAKARRDARRAERDGEGRRGRRGDRDTDGKAEAAFRRRDADGDGFISLAEAEAAALARFEEADADGDGEVSRDEASRGGRGRHRGRR